MCSEQAMRAAFAGVALDACMAVWADGGDEVDEFVSRIPPALREYWVRGRGAIEIRWCTPGSFERARRALRKYVPRRMLDGLVANLYRAACGRWPGERR